MNTGETIALIKAFGNGGGGSSGSNLFVIQKSSGIADKTADEISAAISAGKVVVYRESGIDYYIDSEMDSAFSFTRTYQAGKNYYEQIILINKSNRSISKNTPQLLPVTSSSNNGDEIIVKNGLWTAQAKKFIVTLTPTSPDFSGTMDKTVAEINAAYEAGQEIWFKIAVGSDWTEYPLSRVGKESGGTYPSFNCNALYDENNVLVMIYTGTTNDGTNQTYSTKIYSLTPAS